MLPLVHHGLTVLSETGRWRAPSARPSWAPHACAPGPAATPLAEAGAPPAPPPARRPDARRATRRHVRHHAEHRLHVLKALQRSRDALHDDVDARGAVGRHGWCRESAGLSDAWPQGPGHARAGRGCSSSALLQASSISRNNAAAPPLPAGRRGPRGRQRRNSSAPARPLPVPVPPRPLAHYSYHGHHRRHQRCLCPCRDFSLPSLVQRAGRPAVPAPAGGAQTAAAPAETYQPPGRGCSAGHTCRQTRNGASTPRPLRSSPSPAPPARPGCHRAPARSRTGSGSRSCAPAADRCWCARFIFPNISAIF